MSYLHGKFVWFEPLSGDVEGARRFYEGLLGWQVQTVPIGDGAYRMIQNAGQAIGGYDAAPAGAPACWRSYVSVADVDAAYPKALATGAKGLMPPANVGPMGRAATIADPGGATVSLWKSAEGDAADTPETPDGGWIWNELWTRDDQAALAFYEGLVLHPERGRQGACRPDAIQSRPGPADVAALCPRGRLRCGHGQGAGPGRKDDRRAADRYPEQWPLLGRA